MQNHRHHATSLALLAGAMMFSGEAAATDVIANGSFESASPAGWPAGFNSYSHATTSFYAGAKLSATDDPDAGAIYSWNNLGTQVVGDLATAAGISTSSIDGGTAEFTLGAWLAAYTSNPEFPGIELKFFNTLTSGGSQVGATVSFDGDDPGGLYNAGWSGSGAHPAADTDRLTWTRYEVTGQVPGGARRAEVRIYNAGGLSGAPDTYVDVVTLDVTGDYVPGEPGGLAGTLDEDSGQVTLTWNPPTAPYDAVEVIVLRDGTQLVTLTPETAVYLDSPPLSETTAQTFDYVLRFMDSGGAVAKELESSVTWVPGGMAFGLIANWRFEDGFRDTASAVPAHDGTAVNDAQITGNGVYGKCVNFLDQLKQGVRINDHPTLDFGSSTDFTVSLWMKREGAMNTSLPNGEAGDGVLLCKQNWSNGASPGWGIYATTDGGGGRRH